MSSWSIL